MARAVSQAVFYLQRIPDQLTGPVVELATAIRPEAGLAGPANVWALVSSTLVIGGLIADAVAAASATGGPDRPADAPPAPGVALHGGGAFPDPVDSLPPGRCGRGPVSSPPMGGPCRCAGVSLAGGFSSPPRC